MNRRLLLAVVAAATAALTVPAVSGSTPASAAPGEVLILGSTVSGGAGSVLAQKFVLAGKTPVIVDGATWAGMTAAQFDSYDAIVLGDPTCSGTGPELAATANAAVWSSVVDGNVVIIGSDETFHQGQGGSALMEKAAAFTVAESGKTGAYVSLSCYYHDTAPSTPVPLLSGFGNFTVTGVGCFNNVHITATHPALAGLTDATLSNWSCSVHEAFDAWPVSFEVLAIARGIGAAYTAPDGSVGTPYILARGVEVISDIDLTPATATNNVGTPHTVTATVTTDSPAPGTPVVGTTVTFTVVAGPHLGTTGTAMTDAAGSATFTYTGTATGVDTIEATFVDALGRTQRSNRVEKTWVEGATSSVGGVKFYDTDTDGVRDAGEPGIGAWNIDVTGAATTTVATDADGAYTLEVAPGTYDIAEQMSVGPWDQTAPASGFYDDVIVGAGSELTGLDFGNVCIGDGAGTARSKGFWTNKNGSAAFAGLAGALTSLQALNLRDAAGSNFNPATYAQLNNWLNGATATNMAYMLSAQLAAVHLDVLAGYVSAGALVQAAGTASANANGYATIGAIIAEADAALGADGSTPDGDPNRAIQEVLKNILDRAANNAGYVEAGPADCPAPSFPVL